MTNKNIPKTTAYTDAYKEECFQAWYSAGSPVKILDVIPEDSYGRKPNKVLLSTWREELGWDWRKDELDARAIEIVDDALVQQRVLMLKEQAAKGRKLQSLGMSYLEESDFDSSSSAVTAIIRGADLERSSRGLSEALIKLSKMSDEQLTKEVAVLLSRVPPGDIIDVGDIDIDFQEESSDKKEEIEK